MHISLGLFLARTCTHTHTTTASCFTACRYMRSMQYQSRKILMCFYFLVFFFFSLFCWFFRFWLQYVAQTYGKEADTWFWLRPGSSNICTILISVLFKCARCTRWAGLTILGYSICPREFRVAEMCFSTTLNLPAPVLIVPLS